MILFRILVSKSVSPDKTVRTPQASDTQINPEPNFLDFRRVSIFDPIVLNSLLVLFVLVHVSPWWCPRHTHTHTVFAINVLIEREKLPCRGCLVEYVLSPKNLGLSTLRKRSIYCLFVCFITPLLRHFAEPLKAGFNLPWSKGIRHTLGRYSNLRQR